MSYITAERLGRVLIWAWNKYVKKTAIPYKEIDFHYSDWVFLLTGLVFFGIVLGITLLYFAFINNRLFPMKARLKYPIFSFAPKGNMIYVFRKEELYTTTNTELLKKRKNYIVVDATGTKYVEKGAHKVKWQGIFGYCIRMQGRVISIEYEYGDNPEPFPLRKLQELVAERYPKTRWFKEECWNSADEFRQAIFACKTFEEVADILMPERKTSVWQRIEEYFLRAGFLMLAAMFLYHVVWRLIQKFWLWATG